MFKHPSISRNLTLGLGLAILIVSLMSLSIYYSVQMHKGNNRLEKLGEDYTELIGNALQFPLWNLSAESVTLTATAYANNDIIVLLSVKDGAGNSMFHYSNTDKMPIGRMYTFKVNYEKIEVGTIELALTDFFIKQQNRMVLISGSCIILLNFFCLILMTSFLLKYFLKDPLDNLRRISYEYSAGNYNTRITTPRYTEFSGFISALSDMGATINSQITNLQQAEASLKQHQDQLEEKVVQRTLELKANEQRLAAILKASPVGIGMIQNRHLGWANDAMYHILGYEEATLLGKEARIMYQNNEEYDRVGKELLENIAHKKYTSVETKLVRQDGSSFDCSIRAYSLDPANPLKELIVTVLDISEAKLLEATQQRAEKMETIGTLAGGVAHDLNNILTGIVSYPELLLMDISPDSPLRRPLMTIQKSGEKAVNIVQDLLTMARRGVSVNEVVDINQIVLDLLQSPELKKLLSFHQDAEVTPGLASDLLNVKGSATHLSKSIMNLLSNATESMPNGGLITISTSNIYLDRPIKGYEQIKEGDYVTVVVSDTGTGISAEDIEKIFEPFYTKKTMGRSGTGLGMAVVWGTVKDHNGYIDIKSIPKKGTTMTIYLPATREELPSKTKAAPFDEYKGNREFILVVDDVVEQREVATVMLEKLGYQVSSVSSGEEAVEYMTKNSADLIILDMIMDPGIDGLDAYKIILRMHPYQKAIIASGFSRTERVKELKKLGVGQYLKKPYTIKKLGAAIQNELRS